MGAGAEYVACGLLQVGMDEDLNGVDSVLAELCKGINDRFQYFITLLPSQVRLSCRTS